MAEGQHDPSGGQDMEETVLQLHGAKIRAKLTGFNGGKIMRRIVILGGAFALMAGAALADDAKTNTMIKFADAFAIQYVCKSWTPDIATMSIVGSLYGINLDGPDGTVLMALTKDKIPAYQQLGETRTCQAAELQYGPDGYVVKDLMVRK